MHPNQLHPGMGAADATALLDRLPSDDLLATIDRLMDVSAGDAVLLCALALTALGMRGDTRDRRLREIITETTPPAETPVLTGRQREVLQLLGAGLTAAAIARRLGLSPRTVGKHLERVYRCLGTSDRLTAVIRARDCGLLAGTPRGGVLELVHHREGDHRGNRT